MTAPTLDVGADGDHDRLIAAGVAAVEMAREQSVVMRCLGGVAVALRCPLASTAGSLRRDFSDLDFATTAKHVKGVSKVMKALGYSAHDRFNAANGHSRLLFAQPDGRHVDVFIDRFSLCHELALRDRLAVDPVTVPIADLLLTKLQVAKLAHKDLSDAVALLHDHPLSDGDTGISVPRVLGLLAADWGWWRTSTDTLQHIGELLSVLPLTDAQTATVRGRIDGLNARIEAAPKSMRWRARARVGERRPWREDPEDMEG